MKLKSFKDWRPGGDIIPMTPIDEYKNGRSANRSMRRLFAVEYAKNVDSLLNIEKEFLDILFGDQTESYSVLYLEFKAKWDKACFLIESSKRVKYTKIEETYFTEMYAPKETLNYSDIVLSSYVMLRRLVLPNYITWTNLFFPNTFSDEYLSKKLAPHVQH